MKVALAVLLLSLTAVTEAKEPGDPLVIGNRRELLVDDYLVDKLSGGARLELHQPVPREIVLRTDAAWEGNACGYPSVFQDGKLYRMYYHGGHYRHGGKPAETRPTHPYNLCYAESDDGIHWRRPELGLCEFEGSKKNNIILIPESVAAIKGDPAHTAVFKDANPDCPADARYKCVIVGKPHGLYLLKSADGIRFSVAADKPVITQGAFDSENLAFWDPVRRSIALLADFHRGHDRRQDVGPGRHSRDPYGHLQGFADLGIAGRCHVRRFASSAALHQPDPALLSGPAHLHGLPDALHRPRLVGIDDGPAGP